jgi:hypothetical protein
MIGAAAECFAQLFSYPFEVVRKRAMLTDERGKPVSSGMIDGFVKLVTNEGPFALYRGFSISLVKGVPFAALQFTFVEELTELVKKWKRSRQVEVTGTSNLKAQPTVTAIVGKGSRGKSGKR